MNLKLIKEKNNLKDIIKIIKNLIQENENLKIRISKLEQENEKMKLNLFYNSFDTRAYELESLFQKIALNEESKIIKNKYDLRLINQGIKFLFNNIITDLKLIYRSEDINFNQQRI